MSWDNPTKEVRIESLNEATEVEILIDGEVEPEDLRWRICELPEKDGGGAYSVITLSLKKWESARGCDE